MDLLLPEPISLPKVNTNQHKWSILSELPQPFLTKQQDGWRIKETLNDKVIFSMRRDYVTNRRYTDLDVYSLLGLSLINPLDELCIITEGVSDYITAKLIFPDKNVLGVTTLGGSSTAHKIIISLFNKVVIIGDNDAAGQTGINKWRNLLHSYDIKVNAWIPSFGKDLTDQFLFNYKLDNTRIQF